MNPSKTVWRGLALCAAAVAAADLVGRGLGLGAWAGNSAAAGRIALTFDDGPSERTPELLRVLEKYGARATFFVTAPACRAFPAELESIRAAGHELAAHGRWHRHALLLTPMQEWAQVRWGEGRFYRPPYGGHSPLTRLLCALAGREVALWDAESRDWTPQSAEALAAALLARLRGGEVVLLHDGPAVTPALLDEVLTSLSGRGWQAVTLSELPPRRIGWRAGFRRLRASYGA